ncbi:MAG: CopD family protein [Nevskia sp.]|nr:CopD family protein [Nevskia sp.]
MILSLGIALALHVLSAVVWVGGMFFAYQCLRPSLAELGAAERTALWSRVLGRFFGWVLIAAPLILLSGLWMMFNELPVVQLRVHLMMGLGIAMMLLFLHVYFAPFRRLRRAVAAGDTPLAAQQVGTIRKLVAVNLTLGLAVVLIATAGKYLLN